MIGNGMWLRRWVVGSYKLLDLLVPRGRTMGFISFPDASDNALALFSHLLESGHSSDSLFWLANDVNAARSRLTDLLGDDHSGRCRILKKNSLRGLWHFLRAKRVFFTHGHYWFVRSRRSGSKLVNLWHGMPLKAIGLLDNKHPDAVQATEVAICSSPFFQPIISAAFGIPESRVMVTGLPRCDWLCRTSARTEQIRDFFGMAKIIVWMPTYAISSVGELRSDTGLTREEIKSAFAERLAGLSEMAAKYQIKVVVKLHPMDFLNSVDVPYPDGLFASGQIPLLSRSNTYELLAAAHGLITDVSSVCFDFMITDRPILITTDVLRNYTRKFVFNADDLLKSVFRSDSIGSADAFFSAVSSADSCAVSSNRRFCTFVDDQSSQRVINGLSELEALRQ